MDGMAVVQTIIGSSGPECLKEVVDKFGARMKVYSALKAFLQEVSACMGSASCKKLFIFIHNTLIRNCLVVAQIANYHN